MTELVIIVASRDTLQGSAVLEEAEAVAAVPEEEGEVAERVSPVGAEEEEAAAAAVGSRIETASDVAEAAILQLHVRAKVILYQRQLVSQVMRSKI